MILKKQKYNYAIFGNPVAHSKSPFIHRLFSQQIGIVYNYTAYHVSRNNFFTVILDFFKKEGQGANITSPFKSDAYILSDELTIRAKYAKSVNTLKKLSNTKILGDNTDGIGLLSDLMRLHFIEKHYSILIIGSGGAVRGILHPLLSFGCSVFILNRTVLHAETLVSDFQKYGKISIYKKNTLKLRIFNLVINATPRDIIVKKDFIPLSVISSKTYFYDMNYSHGFILTPFLSWCVEQGAIFFSDGIGMLVFQAAHSCFLWHNHFPMSDSVIKILEKK